LEIVDPVATERCAQQREQSLILIDGQRLSIAKRPTFRGKVEGHDSNLA
jgi:hypothetical protein